MAKQELDLFQLRSRIVTESSARSFEIVRASLETPNLSAYSFTTCQTTFSVIFVPSKNSTVLDLRYIEAIIDGLFHPTWHGDCTDVVVPFPQDQRWPNDLLAAECALSLIRGQ
jgi:hypothetical protein